MQFFTQRFIQGVPASNRRRPLPRNTVLHGDCVQVMATLDAGSVDFILTDPPYITHYRDRSGRTVANDNNAEWLGPAFAQMYRLLKPASFCVSFYGWHKADLFIAAWRAAGSLLLQTRTRVLNGDLDQLIRRRYPAFGKPAGNDLAPVL